MTCPQTEAAEHEPVLCESLVALCDYQEALNGDLETIRARLLGEQPNQKTGEGLAGSTKPSQVPIASSIGRGHGLTKRGTDLAREILNRL